MSPPTKRLLGGRFVVALALALLTSAGLAATGPDSALATTGHHAVVLSLHGGSDVTAAVPHRHASTAGATADPSSSYAVPPTHGLASSPRHSVAPSSPPTGTIQPRGPPSPLSDL